MLFFILGALTGLFVALFSLTLALFLLRLKDF